MELDELKALVQNVKNETQKVVKGHSDAIDLMLVALLCKGHVLLEGVPGTAKTLLAKTFAATLSLDYNRIQFTPDLMPGDVIGTNLFNFHSNQFTLTKGPIFTDVLLADEINRTPPKTQAALLEAMQERIVTIESKTYPLGNDFIVIATQNPIEQQGTYPLPEAQLDRFLFKISVGYPTLEQEREIVLLHGHKSSMPTIEDFNLEKVLNSEVLAEIETIIANVHVSEEIADYIVQIVRETREHSGLLCGASPRSATMLAVACRAHAALQGRPYVIPDDVKYLLFPTLLHRLPLSPMAEIEGTSVNAILEQIIEKVPAPR